MKLWVDDFRDAPDSSWTEVRKVEPAISLISIASHIEEISLDHDIENRPDDETFKPIAYFIGEKFWQKRNPQQGECCHQHLKLPKITIHSDNPVGAREMIHILGDRGIKAEWHPFTTEEAFKTKYGLK